jgi:LPS-assembly protein
MAVHVIFLPGFQQCARANILGRGMPVLSAKLFVRAVIAAACLVGLGPSRAAAQGLPADLGFDDCKQGWWESIDSNHVKLHGAVACTRGDMALFADEVEIARDTHIAILTGNVTFRQSDAQISAERAEFNTETRLGTFFNATGFATVASAAKKDALGGQEPDVYFYGETVEKIGLDRYRISHGGFTTCVQPNPRWQLTSGSVTLRLDHYAFLKNALLKAKGVPVFYLPALFYPIQKDDRATGILMPTYGTSTYRGFTLSNAFFWAIDRSQDATFFNDWYSKRGMGNGAEYRYAAAPGANGYFKFYSLNEHESTYTNSDGSQTVQPGSQSYEIRSNVSQPIGRRWSARGRIDYFSDVSVQQAYNTDIYDISRSSRMFGGSVSGSTGGFSINGSFDRTEFFSGTTDSTVTGSSPRINVTRNEQPLFGAPAYLTVNTEFAKLVRESRSGDSITDRGLSRVDVTPTIRVPFTKLQFLTVNSSLSWRGTYWTRSQALDEAGNSTGEVIDSPIGRSYFDMQARITGPIVNRVWNTPGSGYAAKWKHTVEPYVTVQRVTGIDNFNEIVQLDGADYVVGGTTRVDYGLTNRLLVKRKSGPEGGSAREILAVVLNQTYYSNDQASQYDYNYTTSFTGQQPSNFSPIRLALRASPGDQINGSFRMEYDQRAQAIQSITADGQAGVGEWLHVGAGYSQRRLQQYLVETPVPSYSLDNYINTNAALRSSTNRIGGTFNLNYDIGRSTLLTTRVVGYYNAQCCGFAVEYQIYNFPQNSGYPVTSDRRFNFSFTLAGLGTFSNFFGALGGSGTTR